MITKEQIEQNLAVIKLTIENFNGLDTYAIVEYLGEIVSLQALATETQAAAKFHLLCAIDAELDRQAKLSKNDSVAPSIKKMRADAKCRDWHYIVTLCERYSSNISHTIDACRTKISYLKQEMNNQR